MRKKQSGISKIDGANKQEYVDMSGRRGKDEFLFYFDVKKYKADVSVALKDALFKIRNEMVSRMKAKVLMIPFRDRSIQMANGRVTSDIERKAALIESIVGHMIDGNLRDGVMKMTITAMEDNFEDSHIGFYYEYGTGTQEEQNSPYYLWGDWNPYRGTQRPGQPIVTRGYLKRVGSYTRGIVGIRAHNRIGKNVTSWTDAGGNKRVTNSVIGGMPITTPGWEIESYRWFRNTFDEMYDGIITSLKKALYKVNPLDDKYFYVNKKMRINIVKGTRAMSGN